MRTNPIKPHYDLTNTGHSKEKLANLPAFPRFIDIEMTNTCNFRCLMCPTGNYSQKRHKGFFDKDMFYRVLDEIRPHGTPLRFIRWGEPFTHPDILEFLKACQDAGVLTHANTNGSKFDDDVMRALVDIPLNVLKFSFQGVDRDSYGEMRNIDFFDELIATIRRLVEIRGDAPYPYIQVATTVTTESQDAIDAFRAEMEALVDYVDVGHTTFDFIDLNDVRLRSDEKARLKALMEKDNLAKIHPECPEVFDKLSINWDGTVTACCGDSDNLMLIGDLHDLSLNEIWRSEKLGYYRELLADMRHDDLELCKNCYVTHDLMIPAIQDPDTE
jgi:radical SAM protein with 4Fe4S-binding SPASM domain